jgi:serine/threonine protein kinase
MSQKIITPAQFAKLKREREEEKAQSKKPTLDDRVFEQHEVSAVLQVPYSEIQILNDFELEERIGRGGFSEVFRTTGPDEVERAIKIFNLATGIKNIQDYNDNRKLLRRELDLYQNISHPQIPTFEGIAAELHLDRGKFREFRPALVMEYVNGVTLKELLGKLSPEEFRRVFFQTLSPLEEVHHGNTKERFHRDIKPLNLKLNEDGILYLLDFGTVRDTLISTQMGASLDVGTLGYAHEQQLRGKPSLRTDLYSLGRTFYALATGEEPKHFEVINEGKLKRTNLDPQMKKTIALLCDEGLGGPENLGELRDKLSGNPIEVHESIDDNVGKSGIILLGPPPLPEGLETICDTEKAPEEVATDKLVPRTGRIPDFYEDYTEKYTQELKRALRSTDVLTRHQVENPYNITNPIVIDPILRKKTIGVEGTKEKYPLSESLLSSKGLTKENIAARNRHEEKLRKQFAKGIEGLIDIESKKSDPEKLHSRTEEAKEFLEYLDTYHPFAFPYKNDRQATFLRRAVECSTFDMFKLATTLMPEEKQAYAKLPLTTDTVDFLREQTEGYLEKLVVGKIYNDLVEENIVDLQRELKEVDKEVENPNLFYVAAPFVGSGGLIYTLSQTFPNGEGLAEISLYLLAIGGLLTAAGSYKQISNRLKRKKLRSQLAESELEQAKQLPAPEGTLDDVVGKNEINKSLNKTQKLEENIQSNYRIAKRSKNYALYGAAMGGLGTLLYAISYHVTKGNTLPAGVLIDVGLFVTCLSSAKSLKYRFKAKDLEAQLEQAKQLPAPEDQLEGKEAVKARGIIGRVWDRTTHLDQLSRNYFTASKRLVELANEGHPEKWFEVYIRNTDLVRQETSLKKSYVDYDKLRVRNRKARRVHLESDLEDQIKTPEGPKRDTLTSYSELFNLGVTGVRPERYLHRWKLNKAMRQARDNLMDARQRYDIYIERVKELPIDGYTKVDINGRLYKAQSGRPVKDIFRGFESIKNVIFTYPEIHEMIEDTLQTRIKE